ncbi:MAG: DUF805 domain-containing protein [Patescibacteria group bacterium]|nr:DUF805 domain-containing protein [Patescibacteria group bacterium]
MNYYFEVWKKYALFSGRARRAEYWYFVLFNIIAYIALWIIDALISNASAQGNFYFLTLFYDLAVILPSLAVGSRRLHDTGRSAWWLLIGLVPIAGAIVLIIFFLGDSQPGSNQYGPNPKSTS